MFGLPRKYLVPDVFVSILFAVHFYCNPQVLFELKGPHWVNKWGPNTSLSILLKFRLTKGTFVNFLPLSWLEKKSRPLWHRSGLILISCIVILFRIVFYICRTPKTITRRLHRRNHFSSNFKKLKRQINLSTLNLLRELHRI